ncbi:cold shock domain-containing protein, partial [Bacteroidales bacterium OttesenSCG-928-A17]|nr:cold shock domain-containing protein [Bacteroidales bacterium OttesenSCG-928-A17]
MARSNSFNKRDVEKKKQEKRAEKQKRKEERKIGGTSSFDDMIAYVDENGVITNTPPDERKKQEIEAESIAISIPKKEDIEDPILKGRVEFFNEDKGFGFIKNAAGMDKYFFHISNAPASIREGNKVTFELERGQKGMNAVRISLLNEGQ